MATTYDPEELRRFTRDIPFPAYLATLRYKAMPDPRYRNALLLNSPDGKEELSISKKGNVWLYTDRRNPQNKGTIINWAQHHGAANLGKVRAMLRPVLKDSRLDEMNAIQNTLEQTVNQQRREAGRMELEAFVHDIPLPAFLEKHGYALDQKESSRNSLKFRGAAGILLVSHQRQGAWVYWNASNDQDKGTIIQFCHNNLGANNLGQVRQMLRPELGKEVTWTLPSSIQIPEGRGGETRDMSEAWKNLADHNQSAWDTGRQYLNNRGIRQTINRFNKAIRAEEVKGHVNIAIAHYQFRDGQDQPRLTGWERKGPGRDGHSFSGFSGHRGLAILGQPDDPYHLILCESGIDALSRAELDAIYTPDQSARNVYVSTGGMPGQAANRTLRSLIERHPPASIAIALDNDKAGRRMSDQLLNTIRETDHHPLIQIDQPRDLKDWNDQLRFLKDRGELSQSSCQAERPDMVTLSVESDKDIDWEAVQEKLDAPWIPAPQPQQELIEEDLDLER